MLTTSGEPLDMTGKGDEHSMLTCPFKNLRQQTATYVEMSPSARDQPPVCLICMRAADRSADDMMGFGVDDASIRVTNLSENTSEQDLYNLVSPFGIVIGHSLALDEKTESFRQFGIVEFDQREDAEAAVSWLHGYYFDGLALQVERITSGLNEAVDSPPICSICMRVAETSVHLTNLSEDTCELDLYNLCFPFGIINSLCLSSDKTGSGRQSGIVEFDQREDAEAAIRWLNGYEYGNNTLRVKLATVAELGSASY